MAPEVITQKGYGRFADIWSLGCTIYEMLTGSPPWSDKNQFAVLFQIANESRAPDYPEDISEELKNFMDWWFKREPTERWNIYELLHHPFILQDDNDEEKNCILENGLTVEDDQWLKDCQEELKGIDSNPTKEVESFTNTRRSFFNLKKKNKSLRSSSKAGLQMSMKQLEAIYRLIQLRK